MGHILNGFRKVHDYTAVKLRELCDGLKMGLPYYLLSPKIVNLKSSFVYSSLATIGNIKAVPYSE